MAKLVMGGNYLVWESADLIDCPEPALRSEIALWRDVHATGNTREKRHAAMQMKVLLAELKARGLQP